MRKAAPALKRQVAHLAAQRLDWGRMMHLVLLFHLLVIAGGIAHVTLLLTAPSGMRTPAARAYTVTFTIVLAVLLGSAIVEYVAFNVAGAPSARLPRPVEFLASALSPLLILYTLPALAMAASDPGEAGQRAQTLRRVRAVFGPITKVVSASLYVASTIGGLTVVALPWFRLDPNPLDRLVFEYRAAIVLPVCYVLMTVWAVLGVLDRPWRRMPVLRKRLRGGFVFLLLLIVLMLLELGTRRGVISLPLYSGLARAVEPYGLQLPWILLAVYSAAGSLTVGQLTRTPTPSPDVWAVPGPDFLAGKGLSVREAEIARLIMAGENNKEIASTLGISYNTVKNHIAAIFRKCGVGSRFQLARRLRSDIPTWEPIDR